LAGWFCHHKWVLIADHCRPSDLRNTLQDDKLADKWQGDDKTTLQAAVDETISWLDASSEASKEEYEEHQKELEAKANPIMSRLYGAGGAPEGAAGGPPPASHDDGPSVEEVD
jgi:heat shock 70kDa protein 1/2/6/8